MENRTLDPYDLRLAALDGLPDVLGTKPATLRTITPLVGYTETFIVQTFRQREEGDTIFLEVVSADRIVRLALPPKVADAIARQRDSLTARARSKAARAGAQNRKERGVVPFQKKQAAHK